MHICVWRTYVEAVNDREHILGGMAHGVGLMGVCRSENAAPQACPDTRPRAAHKQHAACTARHASVHALHCTRFTQPRTVVERARGERQLLSLLLQRLDNLQAGRWHDTASHHPTCKAAASRAAPSAHVSTCAPARLNSSPGSDESLPDTRLGVAVALIDRRVSAEEVEILLAVHVPHEGPAAALQHHGNGRIIMCSILLLAIDQLRAGRRSARDSRKQRGGVHGPTLACTDSSWCAGIPAMPLQALNAAPATRWAAGAACATSAWYWASCAMMTGWVFCRWWLGANTMRAWLSQYNHKLWGALGCVALDLGDSPGDRLRPINQHVGIEQRGPR